MLAPLYASGPSRSREFTFSQCEPMHRMPGADTYHCKRAVMCQTETALDCRPVGTLCRANLLTSSPRTSPNLGSRWHLTAKISALISMYSACPPCALPLYHSDRGEHCAGTLAPFTSATASDGRSPLRRRLGSLAGFAPGWLVDLAKDDHECGDCPYQHGRHENSAEVIDVHLSPLGVLVEISRSQVQVCPTLE